MTEKDCSILKVCESDPLPISLVTQQIDDNGSDAGLINKGSALISRDQGGQSPSKHQPTAHEQQ